MQEDLGGGGVSLLTCGIEVLYDSHVTSSTDDVNKVESTRRQNVLNDNYIITSLFNVMIPITLA